MICFPSDQCSNPKQPVIKRRGSNYVIADQRKQNPQAFMMQPGTTGAYTGAVTRYRRVLGSTQRKTDQIKPEKDRERVARNTHTRHCLSGQVCSAPLHKLAASGPRAWSELLLSHCRQTKQSHCLRDSFYSLHQIHQSYFEKGGKVVEHGEQQIPTWPGFP